MTVPLQELGRAVKRLQNRHHRRLDVALGLLGTTLAQWDALRAIEAHPGLPAHGLAELTFQTDQSFGALAGRLLAKGLVERRPGAGRALLHTLSPGGRRILERGSAMVDEVLDASLGRLSTVEREELCRLLDKASSDTREGGA